MLYCSIVTLHCINQIFKHCTTQRAGNLARNVSRARGQLAIPEISRAPNLLQEPRQSWASTVKMAGYSSMRLQAGCAVVN